MSFHHLLFRWFQLVLQESGVSGTSEQSRFAIEKVSLRIHHDSPWFTPWALELFIHWAKKPHEFQPTPKTDVWLELSWTFQLEKIQLMGSMGSMDAKRFQQETYLLCCAQVDLKSFVDAVIAKVQERKVGMPQGGGGKP